MATVIEPQSFVFPCPCGGGFVLNGSCLNEQHDSLLAMAESYKYARLEGARQSLATLKAMVESGQLVGLEQGIAKAYVDYSNELLGDVQELRPLELQKRRDEFLSYGIDIDAL